MTKPRAALHRHEKQRIALRYWMIGRGYHLAAGAMAYAETYHTGTRKDEITPEFAHQVQIGHFLRTLEPHLADPQTVLAIAMLHDVREDYDVPDAELRTRFGDDVADGVDRLTKSFRGVRRNDDDLFARIGESPAASIVKLADRINNHAGMLGVFTTAKMRAYMEQTEQLFLPMAKRARRAFPEQEAAYENARLMLVTQIELLRAVLAAQAA